MTGASGAAPKESPKSVLQHYTSANGSLLPCLCYMESEAASAIPSPLAKAEPETRNNWQNVDPRTPAAAKAVGMKALRRASVPLEDDELQKLASRD